MDFNWHAIDTQELVQHFLVDVSHGLDEAVAADRLKEYGPNMPSKVSTRGNVARLLSQLTAPLVLVLVAAGTVTLLFREWVEAGVIYGVVIINALVGVIQEGKAEASLAALTRSIATETTVLRGGTKRKLDAIELVPGDIIILAAGDKVPADLRLLSSKELRIAEAMLTGESTPVDKLTAALPIKTPLADRQNLAYAGTLVVSGQATGIVIATGDHTETGRIARLIREAPELTTPLTRKIDVFAKRLLVAILGLGSITFAIGILRGESAFDMFMAAVALAIGAIPEGLPAAITITLAIGVARMARRRAIIRKLPAVETLGSTTVICSDKTGTLTENAMTVREVWIDNDTLEVKGQGYNPRGQIDNAKLVANSLHEVLMAGALCNDARLVHDNGLWQILGDPTEGALLVLARKGGLNEEALSKRFPRVDELPFDSSRQYMATLHEIEDRSVIYIKGAVEKLLPACMSMLTYQGSEVPLDAAAIHKAANEMAEKGLRVLALGRSALPSGRRLKTSDVAQGILFLGLVGMIDPPRPHAIKAVGTCQSAGIKVKMITGDHPGTATAIAKQLGIVKSSNRTITGGDMSEIEEGSLPDIASQFNVFARFEPEQKLRLVRALQASGEVVAMTGDGVNDAPALKNADIGIAMGKAGTEVAKEAAAMVLTDDNFATIEAAVEEGRGLYDNLVKFIAWTIPTNAGEGLVILAAIFIGTNLPIAPLQILWINMITAILLGMMLAFEPVERGIMRRPPRQPSAPILDRVLVLRALLVSLFMLIGAFGLFELTRHQGRSIQEAQTVASNVIVIIEIFYLFNCRSLTRPFWFCGANPWVWVGSLTVVILQLIFTYLPVFNRVFNTNPISLTDWFLIMAIGIACAVIIEVEKRWRFCKASRLKQATN